LFCGGAGIATNSSALNNNQGITEERFVNSRPLDAVGAVTLLVGALLQPSVAGAATLPWVGTADYTQAPGAAGDEETVGPFDGYDFANGVSLIQSTNVANPGQFTVGDVFTGYYQSYVSLHQLNGVGVDNIPSALDTDGTANGDQGYELTVSATYTSTITSVDGFGNGIFSVGPGSVDLYFDTVPDYDFVNDFGFTNGASIISATISGGSGAYLPTGQSGFSDVTLSIGAFGYDQNVYDPDTINGGSGIFTLKLNNSGTGPTAGVTAVLGQAVGSDLLLEADGNLNLTAVPIPAAVWLFGSGLLGLVGIAKRKKSA
jgi:hypothetical protein